MQFAEGYLRICNLQCKFVRNEACLDILCAELLKLLDLQGMALDAAMSLQLASPFPPAQPKRVLRDPSALFYCTGEVILAVFCLTLHHDVDKLHTLALLKYFDVLVEVCLGHHPVRAQRGLARILVVHQLEAAVGSQSRHVDLFAQPDRQRLRQVLQTQNLLLGHNTPLRVRPGVAAKPVNLGGQHGRDGMFLHESPDCGVLPAVFGLRLGDARHVLGDATHEVREGEQT
mmetsp:Transcript_106731/g.287233  ORF Transcript_106731/g.287233 Transcript_106731/m.287233 type:complete len:230 (-) Transcript_106731:224-913(-)